MTSTSSSRLYYSLGELTISFTITVISFFQLYFLTDVARLPPAIAGWSIAITKLWDAVNDPLIGVLSDRLRTPWGRRRGPLLMAALPVGASFALLWVVPALPMVPLAVYYTVMFIVFDTCFTVYHVSYNSLMPELSRGYDDRSSLIGLRMIISIVGALVTLIALTLLAGVVPEPIRRFAIAGAIFGVLSLLPPLVVFRATRAYDPPLAPLGADHSRFKLADAVAVLRCEPFRKVLGLYILSWTTATLMAGVLVYFAAYAMRVPEQANYFVLAAEGSAVAFIPLVVWLSRRFDKRNAFIIGCLSWIAVQGALAAANPERLWLVYMLAVLAGFGIGTAYVVPWSMLPDVIDADRAVSGKRQEGSFYAFAAFFQKLGTGFALWLTAQMLGWSGYVTPTTAEPFPAQPESAVTIIRVVIGAVPAVLLIGAVVVALGYRLGRDEQERVARILAEQETG